MTKKYKIGGWLPDLPDARDLVYKASPRYTKNLPKSVDLRSLCSKVEQQGSLGSCTANAIVSCLEYLENRDTGTYADLSRLFLYYQERVIEGTVNEDAGAMIRDGIKSLVKTGVPHESTWPYFPEKFSVKPGKAAYREAMRHRISVYQRLNTLEDMRACLASSYPFVFGMTLYSSFESEDVAKTGMVPMPKLTEERVIGGHAMCAVGYDDITSRFLVRNSWGEGWGVGGYCFIPYAILADRNMSDDFWAVFR